MAIRHFFRSGYINKLAVLCLALQLIACGGLEEGGGGKAELTGTAGPTGTVTLSWTPPSERADNTGLSMADIDSYRIYYGTQPGSYPNRVDITDVTASQATVTIPTGVYFFVMTTYDTVGRESAYSPEVRIEVL